MPATKSKFQDDRLATEDTKTGDGKVQIESDRVGAALTGRSICTFHFAIFNLHFSGSLLSFVVQFRSHLRTHDDYASIPQTQLSVAGRKVTRPRRHFFINRE